MENRNQDQNANEQGTNNGAAKATKAKGGLKTFFDGLHRKYDAIRYSTAGKWVMRGITMAGLGVTAKAAYDKGVIKGKASVVPTVVTIERIPEGTETPEETPAEEPAVEETV